MTFVISNDTLEIWTSGPCAVCLVQIKRAAATSLLRFLLAWLGTGAGYQPAGELERMRRRQFDRALLLARLDAGQEIEENALAWLIGALPHQRKFGLRVGGGEVVS